MSLQAESERNLFAACRCKQKTAEISLRGTGANRKWAGSVCAASAPGENE
jgi:hypothetical protein